MGFSRLTVGKEYLLSIDGSDIVMTLKLKSGPFHMFVDASGKQYNLHTLEITAREIE